MNVLYITYDGLLDPLGNSQILPYIKNALAELDASSVYSSNAVKIDSADCLILLGVGHHHSAMMFLVDRRLVA